MAEVIDGVEYYDGDEAARLLGVKKATLYAYVSRGTLGSYRQGIGRRRLYLRREIEQLRTVQPAAIAGATSRGAASVPIEDLAEPEAPDPWLFLPDDEPASGSSLLPDVSSWAGDH